VLITDKKVLTAAANQKLTPETRYLLFRWAELLDPMTHLIQSADLLLDPVTCLVELDAVAKEYLVDGASRFGDILGINLSTREVLRNERNLPKWFGTEYAALEGALLAAIPTKTWPVQRKRQSVETAVRSLVPNQLAQILQAVTNPTTGYKARLLEQILDVMKNSLQTDLEWTRFDSDLAYLAALVLAEGRDGRQLAYATARRLGQAGSLTAAVDAFADVIGEVPRTFLVAITLRGATSVQNAASFGCAPVSQPPQWPSGGQASNLKLQAFIAEHTDQRGSCPFILTVNAWDIADARVRALSTAEKLVDQIVAEHRLGLFDVDDDVIVFDPTTSRSLTVRPDIPAVRLARTLAVQAVPELERALRFHTLARVERSPLIKCLHSWIAMEHLALNAQVPNPATKQLEPQSAGTFAPTHIQSLVFLSACRNQFTMIWHLLQSLGRANANPAWAELEQWLGVQPATKLVAPQRWFDLIAAVPRAQAAPKNLNVNAPTLQAAGFLVQTADQLGPLASRRLTELTGRLQSGARLLQWCVRIEMLARNAIFRMRRLRNRTVHRALVDHAAAQQLSRIGLAILDATFEVLPSWIQSGAELWVSLRDARAWRYSLVAKWSRTTGSIRLDLARIFHP
jgi:hypothetical protein